MQEPLTLNDAVIIRDTAANRHDAVASLQGIVAGISRSDETGDVHAYAIWLPDLEEVWMFDISQLDAAGQNDPNGIPMSDTSIRVTSAANSSTIVHPASANATRRTAPFSQQPPGKAVALRGARLAPAAAEHQSSLGATRSLVRTLGSQRERSSEEIIATVRMRRPDDVGQRRAATLIDRPRRERPRCAPASACKTRSEEITSTTAADRPERAPR